MDQFTNSSSRKPRLNKHRRAPHRKELSSNQTSVGSVERKMGSWNPFVPQQSGNVCGLGTTKFDGGTFVFGKNGCLNGESSSMDANGNAGNVNNLSTESSLGSDAVLVFSKIIDEIKKLDLRDLKSEKKSENIDSGLFKKLPDEMRKMNLNSSDVGGISKSKEGENSLNLINLVYGKSEKATDRHASFGSKEGRNYCSDVSVDGSKTESDDWNGNSSVGPDESLLSKLPDELSNLNLKNDTVNNMEGLSRPKPINVVSGASEKPTTEDASFESKRTSKARSGVFEFRSQANSKACSGVFELGSQTSGNDGLDGKSSIHLGESLLSRVQDDLSKMNLKNNANVSDFQANKQNKDVFGFKSGTNSSKPMNNTPASFDGAKSVFSDSNVFIFGSSMNSSANLRRESSIDLNEKVFSQLPDDLGKLNLNSARKISDFDKNKQAENTFIFEGSMNNSKQANVASEKPIPDNSGVFVFGSGVNSCTNLSQNSFNHSDENFFSNRPNDQKNVNLTNNVDSLEKKRQDQNVFVSESSISSLKSDFGSVPIPNSKGSGISDSATFVFGSGIEKNVGSSQISSSYLDNGLLSKISDGMKKMNFNSGDNIEKSKSGDNVFVCGANRNTSLFSCSSANQVPEETAKCNAGIDASAQSMKNRNIGSLRGNFESRVGKGLSQNDKSNDNDAYTFGANSINPLNNSMENLNSTGNFSNKFDIGFIPSSLMSFSSSEPPIMDFKTPLTKEALFPEIHQNKSFSTKKGDAKKTYRKMKNDISRQSVPIFQNGSMKFTPERSEVEAKTDVDSNGDFSPMDCSPYRENVSTDQYSRETYVVSEDTKVNSGSYNEREEVLVSEAHMLNISADSASIDDQLKKENMGFYNESRTSSERPTCEDIGGSNFIFTTSSFNQVPVPAAKPNSRRKDRFKTSHNLSSSSSGSRARFRSSPQPDLIPRTSTSVLDSVAKTTSDLLAQNKGGNEKVKGQECDATQETLNSKNGSVAAKVLCEKWRLRGNEAYSNGDLNKAEECYTRGVRSISSKEIPSSCIQPLTLCYSNRAATRMLLGKFREALRDCKMAVSMDPTFLKARVRAANCHLALGEVEDALEQFKNCLQMEKNDSSDQKYLNEASAGLEKAQHVADLTGQSSELLLRRTANDASKALNMICEALLLSPHSENLLKLKAEALLMMRNYNEVIKLCEGTSDLAEKNFGSPLQNICSSAKLWRSYMIAKSYFHLGKLEEALELLQKHEKPMPAADKTSELSSSFLITVQELLRLKSAGNEAFQAARHLEAVEYYTSALACNAESRPFTAVCFCNRAAAFQALGQITDAIADCSLAIALDASYAKAISRRATLHEMIRDYSQAASDLNRLIFLLQKQIKEKDSKPRAETSSSVYTELKQARARLATVEKKSREEISLDMYMILGVEQSSSAVDIKKAYRKAALRHHPDKAGQSLVRNENADDEVWREVVAEVHADADRLFKMIGEAYTTLSDPSKREQYDEEEEMRSHPVRRYNASSPKYSSDAYNNYYSGKSFWREWRSNANAHQRW